VEKFITDERMYQAGLLRIALRMRNEKDRSFEQILDDVTRTLRLDPEGFRSYVMANMQVLMAEARQRS
jgi:hypothetical protein